MIDFIKQSKEKIIVLAYNTDRLQRDFDEQSLESRGLVNQDRAEIHFVSTKQKITKEADSSTKFRYGLDVLLANDYANRISDNVKRSNQKKLEEGTILGEVAVGYLSQKHHNKEIHKNPIVSIDWDKAVHIQRIFELYATGNYSCEQISRTVGEEGFITREGNKPTKNSIDYILKKKFYIGYYETIYGIATHPYETFVSEDLFNKCQEVRCQIRKTKAKGTTVQEVKDNDVFIYNGFIKCHYCKSSYSSERETKNKNKWTYLRTTKPKDKCPHCKNTNEQIVTHQIVDILKRISISQDTLDILQDELKDKIKARSDVRQKQIEQFENQLADIKEQRKSNLRRLISKDPATSITINIYNNMEHILDEDGKKINIKLAILRTTDKHFRNSCLSIFELASKASELWISADNIRRREILRIIFSNLYLDGKTLIFTMRKPFNLFLKQANHTEWLPSFNIFRNKQDDILSTMNRPMMEGVRLCLAA